MNPPPSKSRRLFWAAVNAAALLPPIIVYLIYSRCDDFVYDFAYALAAKWVFIAGVIVSAAIWGAAYAMREWKRRSGGASRTYRVAALAMTGFAILVVATVFALIIAEFLSPLYLPAFNELSGLHQVEDDAALLYTLKPNSRQSYRALGTHEKVEYKINSLGVRGAEFSREKAVGVFRILAIGDSMTFGLDANIEDSYAAQLEAMLNEQGKISDLINRFEVINGGVSGYNTWNEVNFLERRGLDLDPDLIIFQFCFNDTGDPISLISAISYFHFKSLPEGLFPSPEMLRRNEETILTINRKAMSLKTALLFTLRNHSRLFGYFNRAWAGWSTRRAAKSGAAADQSGHVANVQSPAHRSYFHDAVASLAETNTPEFDWLKENLVRLKNLADDRGAPVILLVPPMKLQVSGENETYNAAYRNVMDLAREIGFTVCAPLDALKYNAAGDPARLFNGVDEIHYNKSGNAIIAEELLKEIQAKN